MFVADLHNDILQRAIIGEDITKESYNGHSDIPRLIDSKINLEVFVIWITKYHIKNNAFNRARQLLKQLQKIEEDCDLVKIVKSPNDLFAAKKKSILAIPFGIEGGECLENNLKNLQYFIEQGLLYFGPTWNYSNALASSAYDEVNSLIKSDQLGLKKFGKDVIQLCEDSGVIIDVSHIGEKSFWDIVKISTKPIIASHSCVYNLCPHFRNLKDDQIKAIKKKNGAVFVNLYPNLIDKNFYIKEEKVKVKYKNELNLIDSKYNNPDERWINKQYFLQKKLKTVSPKLGIFINHVEYIIQLVGVDYVGIGSDYDGIDCLPKEFTDCTDHMLIVDELKSRGYSNTDIEKVMGLNFLRIYKDIKS